MGTDERSCRGLFCFARGLCSLCFHFRVGAPNSPVCQSCCRHLGWEWGNHFTWDLTDCQCTLNSNFFKVTIWFWAILNEAPRSCQATVFLRMFYCCTFSSVVFVSTWLSLPALLPVFSFPFVWLLVGMCVFEQSCPRQSVLCPDCSFYMYFVYFFWMNLWKTCLCENFLVPCDIYRGNSHISHLKLSLQVFTEDRKRCLSCSFSSLFQYSLCRYVLAW